MTLVVVLSYSNVFNCAFSTRVVVLVPLTLRILLNREIHGIIVSISPQRLPHCAKRSELRLGFCERVCHVTPLGRRSNKGVKVI